MPKLNGDWFHSRTGSQLSELAAIQLLVSASLKTEFIGKKWGADRNNQKNKWIYYFSSLAKLGNDSIQPSTMQTKIRNWIRLGFLKDNNVLPLEWTQLGLLWVDAVDDGRGGDANLLYRLIIANALSTISFTTENSNFDKIPVENGLVVKFLVNKLKVDSNLTKEYLEQIIDGNTSRKVGKNYSYWITDLQQSGLFLKNNSGGIKLGNMFPIMLEAISKYKPLSNVTAQEIKNNPLASGAPFRDSLIREFEKYGSQELIGAVETLTKFTIQLSSNQIQKFQQATKQRERNSSWSKTVKENYHYHCVVPGCDAQGTLFIQAAHIMPFNVESIGTNNKHRNDVENGVALCLSCHKLFDAGLFTFDEEGKVMFSKFIYSSELIQTEKQINVERILKSSTKKIYIPQNLHFNKIYALYHRDKVFLGE